VGANVSLSRQRLDQGARPAILHKTRREPNNPVPGLGAGHNQGSVQSAAPRGCSDSDYTCHISDMATTSYRVRIVPQKDMSYGVELPYRLVGRPPEKHSPILLSRQHRRAQFPSAGTKTPSRLTSEQRAALVESLRRRTTPRQRDAARRLDDRRVMVRQ
jgi:hypothetical protein